MRRILVMLTVVAMAASADIRVTAAQPRQEAAALRVIVIDGAEAANIVAEKIAAEPVVEVRDKDNRRAVGAVVRFVIRKTARDRVAAVFHSGDTEVRLTDAAGQARATALTPLEPGSFEIEVQVSHQGQTATTTLRHTNYPTVAEARAAGRQPGQSRGQTAGSTAGSTAGATAGAAATVPGVAAGGGVGLGKLAVIGLAVGGAAAGTAVALSKQDSNDPPASITALTPSQTNGVQAATPFTFTVQATNFDAGSLTYRWEFGDGATSSEPTPTHVYQSVGTYTVAVTVSDGRQSVRSETTVTIFSLTGTWLSTGGRFTLQLSQSGSTVTGQSTSQTGPGELPYSDCAVSGSIESAVPAVILLNQARCSHPRFGPLAPIDFRLNMAVGGQSLSGTWSQLPVTSAAPIAFNRQ